jgi:hypothetical protein
MRTPWTLTLLLGVALWSANAWAQPQTLDELMPKTPKPTTKADIKVKCAKADMTREKANGGFARGRGANADGGSNGVGPNTGNGGVALGDAASASGGDNNRALEGDCAGRSHVGNGGVAVGRGVKANGGSGNIVKF